MAAISATKATPNQSPASPSVREVALQARVGVTATYFGHHPAPPLRGDPPHAGEGPLAATPTLPSPRHSEGEGKRRIFGFVGLTLAAAALAFPTLASPPARVMSLNVCTDQLAMLLAAPGQLVSVSFLADDPTLSFLHEEAAGYEKNSGLAEQVFLTAPDLVVTGTYSLHNTTELLRSLGFRVEEFEFAQTLDTIPREIRRMGDLLGSEKKAERIAADFETELAEIEAAQCEVRPTAIAWDQNGIALGGGTLADSVMQAAGLKNLAAEVGVTGMAPFPLELLVEHQPDIVILPENLTKAPSLADKAVEHPALKALEGSVSGRFVPSGAWTCAGPFTLEAVKALKTVREAVDQCEVPQ